MPQAGCAVGKLRKKLSEADVEALDRLLESELTARVVVTVIAEHLNADIGPQTVTKHRGRVCRCE
jgi:hypothetical protein